MTKAKPKRGRPAGPSHSTRSIRLPDSLWDAIEAVSCVTGQSVNSIVRTLIERKVKRSTSAESERK